jgi:hypothetical protein
MSEDVSSALNPALIRTDGLSPQLQATFQRSFGHCHPRVNTFPNQCPLLEPEMQVTKDFRSASERKEGMAIANCIRDGEGVES